MATPVVMPKAGNSVEECLLTTWRVKPGDAVASGAVLADIETDKATFEIEAPVAGTLLEVFWSEGDLVPVMQTMAGVVCPAAVSISRKWTVVFSSPMAGPVKRRAADANETARMVIFIFLLPNRDCSMTAGLCPAQIAIIRCCEPLNHSLDR